ncbi:MAG: TIGR02757 family protein [Desulfobacteraceae bacterium]|jgi:uncharacterized protein (TIGR02757 family)
MKSHTSPLTERKKLDELYASYNHRAFVHPDPLEFLYDFPELLDREIVALIASSLAYGRVSQILKSVSSVLDRMSPSPFRFIMNSPLELLRSTFSDFKHRFTGGDELSWMLWGARRAIEQYGSLLQWFLTGYSDDDDTILPALSKFVRAFLGKRPGRWEGFMPSPNKGSACKRLNLFMRWMVRQDAVDPGGWNRIPASKLIIPLDTHMHRIALSLGLTKRRQADMRTAIKVTAAFREIVPEDPVRYDFVLTRLGIRRDMDQEAFFGSCGIAYGQPHLIAGRKERP